MNLVREPALLEIKELQIGLMDQRSSLKRMIGTLCTQVPGSDPMQFVVQRRRKFVQRGVISGAQLFEEL